MDRGAWWATVYGVAKSQTRLKQLSMHACTKKAECWRTEAFKSWCWRRLMRVPWTARRSNQSILKWSFKIMVLEKTHESPLDCKEIKPINPKVKLSNYGAGEDSWEALGQQGDQTSQSYKKSTLSIHWKDWCWSSNPLATWCEEPTHWQRPWC